MPLFSRLCKEGRSTPVRSQTVHARKSVLASTSKCLRSLPGCTKPCRAHEGNKKTCLFPPKISMCNPKPQCRILRHLRWMQCKNRLRRTGPTGQTRRRTRRHSWRAHTKPSDRYEVRENRTAGCVDWNCQDLELAHCSTVPANKSTRYHWPRLKHAPPLYDLREKYSTNPPGGVLASFTEVKMCALHTRSRCAR